MNNNITIIVEYSSQLEKLLLSPGICITAFELGVVKNYPNIIIDNNKLSYKSNIEHWYEVDTVVNADNSLSVCINPTENPYSNYLSSIDLLYLRYKLNNYIGTSLQPMHYLGGLIYLVDNGQLVPIKYKDQSGNEIYNLDPINNIIKLPMNYNSGTFEFNKIGCEIVCNGNEQTTHYDSDWYQDNSYFKSLNDNIVNSFIDLKSATYEINTTKYTSEPTRNYNTFRLSAGGVSL